jgi:hypothetical protein
MNLAVKFNLLKDTQPHYIYKPESCLENDNYKLYFDRTVLTDIHIQHNRPDIIILNKQQKQAYLDDFFFNVCIYILFEIRNILFGARKYLYCLNNNLLFMEKNPFSTIFSKDFFYMETEV